MQKTISNIKKWAFEWGFRFSVNKSKTVFFTRKRNINEDLKIRIYGNELERVNYFRYLGLWFDHKLLWADHIAKVMGKCKKVLNVMRCLRGVDWGANRAALRTIYTGLIRSVIDYGCFIYGSAASSHLMKLDVVQYKALRLCYGAFKTTPVAAIQVEMGEMPLRLRREQLALVYWANLKGHNSDHPSKKVLLPCQEKEKKQSPSFGWTIEQMVQGMEVSALNVSSTVMYSRVPPWRLDEVPVNCSLLDRRENGDCVDDSAVEMRCRVQYSNSIQVFTDASKIGNKVGVAFVVPELNVKVVKRISDDLAVFTSELAAIRLALLWVEDYRPKCVAIWSDSSSALVSLKNMYSISRQDIVYEVLQLANKLQKSGIRISFGWVPAHMGVKGNELADRYAKQAIQKQEVDINEQHSKSEVRSIIKKKVRDIWQYMWDHESTGRNLYKIQRRGGGSRNTVRNNQEENIISKMRFGHVGLNNIFAIINKHADGLCVCGCSQETIDHVVEQCPMYHRQRKILFSLLQQEKVALKLSNILQRNSGDICFTFIFHFLKETRLFYRI